VAFSPDGKYIVSGQIIPAETDLEFDKSLPPDLKDIGMILWDATTGKVIHAFPGQTGSANGLLFSPDGKEILATIGGRIVRFDVASGQPLGEFEGEGGRLNGLATTADFKTLVAGGRDKKFFVWDMETGERWTSDTMASEVTDVAISPDGKYVVATSAGKLHIYDLAAKQIIRTYSGHIDEVRQLKFASDGRTIFSGSTDTTVRHWRLDTRDEMIAWAEANRYFPELNCEQQRRYGLAQQPCDAIK